jgi:hypothetical protein
MDIYKKGRSEMKRAGLIGVMLLLGGCGSSQPLFTSDGRPTQLIQCSERDGWQQCVTVAQAQCGGGAFDTLKRSSSDSTLSMLIACRRPASAY